jgi:hypothetical protein
VARRLLNLALLIGGCILITAVAVAATRPGDGGSGGSTAASANRVLDRSACYPLRLPVYPDNEVSAAIDDVALGHGLTSITYVPHGQQPDVLIQEGDQQHPPLESALSGHTRRLGSVTIAGVVWHRYRDQDAMLAHRFDDGVTVAVRAGGWQADADVVRHLRTYDTWPCWISRTTGLAKLERHLVPSD